MAQIDYNKLFRNLDTLVVPHSAFEGALECLHQVASTAKRYAEPDIAILLGASRSGKTRALEIVEQEFPTYRTAEQQYRPIVRIRITRKPTTKAVLTQLLHAIGDPFYAKGTESQKLVRLVGLLKAIETKVIMLDEFQHFVSERGGVNYEVADLFKLLSDEARVSLVLAGLPKARAVIDSNEQLAGRSMRPIYLDRFDWNVEEEKTEFMKIVVSFAQTLAPIRLPDFDDDEWGFRWFCATGGLIGYVAKIFRTLLNHASRDKRDIIGLEHLQKAYLAAVCTTGRAVISPFSDNFLPEPTPEAISHAFSIGTPQSEFLSAPSSERTSHAASY